MSSSIKIFRPWISVPNEEKHCESMPYNETRNSTLMRVPESGYPISEFAGFYKSYWNNGGGRATINFEDRSNSLQTLPLQFIPENLAQNLSYLDTSYLNLTFPEIFENSKITKLKPRPKKFRCPHCKVSFSNNGQLKGHVRIHTGERPFKCDSEKCGKSFTRNEELTRHKRIHTGLRPFPCDQCGKRFGRKDHLKKHIRTHFPQPRFFETNLISMYPILFGY